MRTVFTLLLLVFFPTIAPAADSFDGCDFEVTSLPAVLSTQGVWCMKGDLSTAIASGAAITIAANNVTLDCNRYKLGGLAAGPATATRGIQVSNRVNVVVRQCNIRGFQTGLWASGTSGLLVEDNLFEANTSSAIDASALNDAAIIRRNRIEDTGGTTQVGSVIAISLSGNSHIIDNFISGLTNAPNISVFAIYGTDLSGTVTGNRIDGMVPTGSSSGTGIYLVGGHRTIVDGNFIQGAGPYGAGIACNTVLAVARNNVVLRFPLGIQDCTQVGNHVDPD